jgi:hypothetical protein
MRDINFVIAEYCERHLPHDPAWLAILSRNLPGLLRHLDSAASVRKEIQDHLKDSFEASLLKEGSPEAAWRIARDSMGEISRGAHPPAS